MIPTVRLGEVVIVNDVESRYCYQTGTLRAVFDSKQTLWGEVALDGRNNGVVIIVRVSRLKPKGDKC